MGDDDLSVRVSPREIYDEIVGMRSDVRSLGEQTQEVRDQLADHEARLRTLEAWKYALPIATLATVVGAVVQLLR
ncbi:hypothetical protein ATKI12_5768 [Kitasatospora sp. Ki12]